MATRHPLLVVCATSMGGVDECNVMVADVHQHLGHNHPLWWLPDEERKDIKKEEQKDIKKLADELRQRTVIPENRDLFEARWTEVLDTMAREKAAYLYEQAQARVHYQIGRASCRERV